MTSTSATLSQETQALKELGVWSDILPDVDPSQIKGVLQIKYPSGTTIGSGKVPAHADVQGTPSIHFQGDLDSGASYTMIMTDPDLMKTNDPIDKQVRHWVQAGLTPNGSGELTSSKQPHTTFLPSAPMPMTGEHRYIFILAKESRDIGIGQRGGEADFKERLGFVAQDFIKENGLTVVGVAAMKVAPTAAAGQADVQLMAESAKHLVTG